MQRICKYCGARFDGAPHRMVCGSCADEHRHRSTKSTRVCEICGITYLGGPAARFCPDCRAERKKEQDAEHSKRKALGNVRKLGSTDYCIRCGNPYTVEGGKQRFCPDCRDAAYREHDSKMSSAWIAANLTPARRREERQAASAPITCPICGKAFVPHNASLTCSPQCAKTLKAGKIAAWEAEHRESRNEYKAEMRRKKLEAMTPEERAAYRADRNAKARAAYKARKDKKGGNK